jgi:hypothetical protein
MTKTVPTDYGGHTLAIYQDLGEFVHTAKGETIP